MIPAHYYSCIVAQFEQTNMENIDGMLAVADLELANRGGAREIFSLINIHLFIKGGAPNSGRFLIPDKRSFMLDFSETHWCILANLIPQVDLS